MTQTGPTSYASGDVIDCYVRNSSAFQVDNWRAEFQKEKLPEVAKDAGFEPVVWEEQGVSGESIDNRPKMQEILSRVRRGVSRGIACVAFDRLSRDMDLVDGLIIWREIKTAGGVIVTPGKVWRPGQGYDDDGAFMEFWQAARYKRAMLDNLYQGMVRRAEEAPMFRGRVPIGYMRQTRTEADKRGRVRTWRELVIDDEVAPIVRYVFEQWPKRPSDALLREMNERGRSDQKWLRKVWHADGTHERVAWYRNDLRRMIANPIYYGLAQFGRDTRSKRVRDLLKGDVIRHQVPELAIVDGATWKAAQKAPRASGWKEGYSHRHPRQIGSGGPFSGILHCPGCGAQMYCIRAWTGDKRDESGEWPKKYVYRCSTYHRTGRASCKAHQMPEAVLIEAIKPKLLEVFKALPLRELATERLRADGQAEKRQALEARRQALADAKRQLFEDRYMRRLIGDADFAQMNDRINAETERTQADLLGIATAPDDEEIEVLTRVANKLDSGALGELLSEDRREWWRVVVPLVFARVEVGYEMVNRRHGARVWLTDCQVAPTFTTGTFISK